MTNDIKENHKIAFMRFGTLSVCPKFSFTLNAPDIYETCTCDCGQTKIYKRDDLLSGKSNRCGICDNIPRIGSMPEDIYGD